MAARRMRKTFGVGVNDSDYQVSYKVNGKQKLCPIYSTWKDMLKRSHSSCYKSSNPSYKDVTCCKEWLLFSTFRLWMLGQDYEGKDLDKDLLSKDGLLYSPETAIFISHQLNTLLRPKGQKNKLLPLGVMAGRHPHQYYARIKTLGKQRHLGTFNTVEAAHQAYKDFITTLLIALASKETDPRIMKGIATHIAKM
jgi:hypothetical protein